MILRWLLGTLFGAIALLIAGVVLVLGTDSGSAWLAREAQSLAPDVLRIGPVTGNVLAGVQIESLDIRMERKEVSLHDIRMRLAATGLLRGHMEFPVFDIGRLAVVMDPDPDDKSPILVPTIRAPVPVELTAIRIASITVRTPAFERVVTDLQASALLHESQLEIHELQARSGEAAVGLSGTAELRHPLPLRASVQWTWDRPALQGSGTVQGDLDMLTIRQDIRGPGAVTAEIVLHGLATRPTLDATASWDTLSITGAGVAATSQGGRLSLAGAWDEWHGSLAARLAAPKLPAGVAAIAVHGARNHVTIDELRLGGAFGLVTGSGTADLGSAASFALDLVASDIDPASLRPDARGRLSARLRLSGQLPGVFDAQISGLEGTLMGRPVAGHGSLGYRGGGWDVRDVDLSAGPNRLSVAGRLAGRIEGKFKVEAPRLDIIWPGLEGSLHGHGDIAGTMTHPVGEVGLTGRNLRAGDRHVRSLEFQGRIESRETLQIDLDAKDLVDGENHFGNLHARASGRLARHEFEARLSGGEVTASIAGHGGWADHTLREEITAATASAAPVGEWRLQPAGVHVETDGSRGEVADHCWLQGDATLCAANLRWSPGAASLSVALRDLSTARLADLVPTDWIVAGTVGASLTLRHDGGGTYGNLGAEVTDAALYFVGGDEPLVRTFPVAKLAAEISPKVLTAEAEITGDAGIELHANAQLEDPFLPSGRLSGRVAGKMADLGDILPLLIPGTAELNLAGRLTLDAVLAGTRDAPRVTGELAVRDGTLALPGLGVRLETINVTARGSETATLAIEGSARSGGDVTLSGSIELTGEGAPAGILRIRGRDLDAVKLSDRYVRASPDVTLRYRAGRLSVDGTVEIPKAEIIVRALPATAVPSSPDVVVHDRPVPASERNKGMTVDGGLKLVLGDAVHLKAFGLDTRLAGELRFYQTPDGYAAGEGVVRLEQGRFSAYGSELAIERGNLMFSGPLDNPGLDVRASRRVDYEAQSVTVGLQLTGTAEHVESHVFSDPAMGEADALSYLVSGRPLAKSSAADQASVGSAAIALGLGQTGGITNEIGSAVKLDELGFGGSNLKETEVVAGKNVNPDLYVRFAYGLFNHVGSVLARYRLSKRVSIEASSGETQSLDLIYSIETN